MEALKIEGRNKRHGGIKTAFQAEQQKRQVENIYN